MPTYGNLQVHGHACICVLVMFVVVTHTYAHTHTSAHICPCLCPGSARPRLLLSGPPPPPLQNLGPSGAGVWGERRAAGNGLQPALDAPYPTPPPQSFSRIRKWLEHAHSSPSLTVLAGGQCDDSVGYFVEPCIIESKDPQDPIMKEVMGGAARGREEAASPPSMAHAQGPGASRGVIPSHRCGKRGPTRGPSHTR